MNPFQSILTQSILAGQGDSSSSKEGPHPFPREGKNKVAKIHCRNLKIFFSRTTGPFSTKVTTKHHWMKMIQL